MLQKFDTWKLTLETIHLYPHSQMPWWLKVSLWNLSKPFFACVEKKSVGFFPPDVLFVSWRVTWRWSHQKNTFRWLNLPFAMNTYPFQSAQWGKYPPENWHKYPPWMDAWKIFSAWLPAFYTLTKGVCWRLADYPRILFDGFGYIPLNAGFLKHQKY